MKLFVKSVCIAFVLTVLYSVIPFQAECTDISNEVFRLHILASSDSEYDQNVKLSVRDKVLEYTESLFQNAKSKEDAEQVISQNLPAITEVAQNEVYRSGSNDKVKAEITNMYFTTRHYDSYTLPSGMYDALRITIGEGKGHNWWCVMYPSLCIYSEENRDEKAKEIFDDAQYDIVKNEKYEYKFKIVEIFEKCSNFLSTVL